MKLICSRMYFTLTLLVMFSLTGCGKDSPDSGKQGTAESPQSQRLDVQGQVKLVLVRGEDFSFSAQLFLLAEPKVYHLTFDSLCTVEGGSDSSQDGDGFPMVIGGKHFLIHSGATYRIGGVPQEKGTVLSTRPTTPLLVDRFACVTVGTGTSYAFHGWDGKSTTWAPPEALAATGILVNDSEMTMKVEDGKFVMGGGKTIDINSVASWAARP